MEPAHLAHGDRDSLFSLRRGDIRLWLHGDVERIRFIDGELVVHHLVRDDGADVLPRWRENVLRLSVDTNHARGTPADTNLLVEYGLPAKKLVCGILVEHCHARAR